MWSVVLFALVSAAGYFRKFWGAVDSHVKSRRRRELLALQRQQRKLRRDVEAVGSLFAKDEVAVSSEVEGRVEQVLVDVGDRVEWVADASGHTVTADDGAFDVIVLDRNPFVIPPHELSDAKVLLTLFAGREVYRDPALPAGATAGPLAPGSGPG